MWALWWQAETRACFAQTDVAVQRLFGPHRERRRRQAATASDAGLAALAPMLSCSQPGLKAICKVANALLGPGLEVSIESASFSWISPQWVKGIVIRDSRSASPAAEQRTYVTIDEVALRHGLFRMAFAGKKEVVVAGLIIDPAMDKSGSMSLLAVALSRSRISSLPVGLSGSTKDQLAAIKRKAENAASPMEVCAEQAPVVFRLTADTDAGRSAVHEGAIWLPMEASDLFGGPVSVHCCLGVTDTGRTIEAGDEEGEGMPPPGSGRVTSERAMAELARDAGNGVQLLLATLNARAASAATSAQPKASRPVAAAIESNNLRMDVLGWVHEDGGLELAQPARVTAALSPAPVRRALARISPLLGSTVPSGEEGHHAAHPDSYLNLQLAPERGEDHRLLVPSSAYDIQLEPLKLSLRRSALLDNLLQLMEKNPNRSEIVPAWLAQSRVKVGVDGSVRMDRADMQIAGMHVCTWGKYDPTAGLDVSLGLPTATMVRILNEKGLKLKRMHPDYVFQIQVKGSLSRPSVDWRKASAALIALGLKLQAEGLAKSSAGVSRMLQRLAPLTSEQLNNWLAKLTTAPTLTVDLPWLGDGSEAEEANWGGAT
eukprot:jgi/Tetstr1/461091/TSEL_006235.t2